jgi:hypothetical protein
VTSVENLLAAVETAVADADVTISTELGGQRTTTTARLWRGQVLVDWEPDRQAGDCLVRPDLLRRLIALHARVQVTADLLTMDVPGRVVASLSDEHAKLVRQLGGARRLELALRLWFSDGVYRTGTESFAVGDRGQRAPLLEVRAEVRPRSVATYVARDDVMGPSSRV